MKDTKQKASVWFTRNLESNRLRGSINTEINYTLHANLSSTRQDCQQVQEVPASKQVSPNVAKIIY